MMTRMPWLIEEEIMGRQVEVPLVAGSKHLP
jgi:hypothetical protein